MSANGAATPTRPRRAAWWKGQRGEWYVVVQAILFVLIAVGPRAWPGWQAASGPLALAATALGIVLMLLGGALAVGGLIALGNNNLTPLPFPKEEASLVTRGPYAIVRHPIYSGLIVAAVGLSLRRQAPLTLAFTIGLFVLFDLKTRREEAWLTERFPEYRSYRQHTKKLLPWIY